jgi:hypothetical protein
MIAISAAGKIAVDLLGGHEVVVLIKYFPSLWALVECPAAYLAIM